MAGLLDFINNLPGANAGANPLASGNLGQITEQGGFDSASDPDLLRRLSEIKQYDPNASIGTNQVQQGDSTRTTYNISYDQSKLPKPDASLGQVGGPQGIARIPQGGWGSWNSRQMQGTDGAGILHSTINPSLIQHNDIYGDLTPGSNVRTQEVPRKKSLFETLGPMIPMLFAGAMNPGLLSGLGGNLSRLIAGMPQMLDRGNLSPMDLSKLLPLLLGKGQ